MGYYVKKILSKCWYFKAFYATLLIMSHFTLPLLCKATHNIGKLNFYVSAVDDILKQETDNPTIGILLCRKKNKVIAEYALRHIESPISVNEFKLLDKLPKEYENILPSAEDIENRLNLDVMAKKED